MNAQGQTQGRASYNHQGPVLGVCWNKVRSINARAPIIFLKELSYLCEQEGSKVFSCGADNAARMFELQTGQSGQVGQQVAQHDAPIKCVRWIDSPQGGILATESWDKTVKVRRAAF